MGKSAKRVRECGECTLCCKLLGIIEIKKPANQLCPHQEKNCTIYTNRPESCRNFNCLWLEGKSWMNPQTVGVVMVRSWERRITAFYLEHATCLENLRVQREIGREIELGYKVLLVDGKRRCLIHRYEGKLREEYWTENGEID